MNTLKRFAAADALILLTGPARASYSLYLDVHVCCGGTISACSVPPEKMLVGFAYCRAQCDAFVSAGPSYAYSQAAGMCGSDGVTSYTLNGATCEGTEEPECAAAGVMLRAGLSGGGFVRNGFSSLNAFGAEEGEAFTSNHYSQSFADWSDDSLERWRSYLARNAIAKETGIAVWPRNPFARSLEWLYNALAGAKKPAVTQVTGPFKNLDSSPETVGSAQYQDDFAGKIIPFLRGPEAAGPADGSDDVATGNNFVQAYCKEASAGSIAPSFGISYNSLYGGQAESTGLKIERFPDGRAVFTDSSNTHWTFRPYGPVSGKGDHYYRPQPGSGYRLVYGNI